MTKDNLSGAYSLDALSAEERAIYEATLRGSEEARSEATELQDTAVLLGLAVTPVTPSAELRARLLAQVAATPQLSASTEVDAAPGPAETRARARWSRPIATAVSVAAAVALIVGGIAVGTTSLHPEPTLQATQMAAINAAPDMDEVEMTLAGGEQITLRWAPSLASSVIIVDGMEAAPDGSAYQLWYIGESGARSAGMLPVAGDAESWHVLEGDMQAGDMVGVTVEPESGSEKPSSDPIMLIEPV